MLDKLDKNVALKVDDLIVLDYSNVQNYLSQNPELIKDIRFTDHHDYHFDYGYNQKNQPVKIGYKDDLIQRIIIKTKDYPKKRLKLTISYDGTSYYGFQIQGDNKTIQGEISKLVSEVNNHFVLVQGASRTDSGVHAIEQVLHFDDKSSMTENEWLRFLNHRLPKDIFVKSIEKMHPLFHSRYDVYEKIYQYKIKLGDFNPFVINYSWHIEYLDFIRLDDQLKKIIGSHDFTSFAKTSKGDSTRVIYDAGYKIEDETLKIYIRGNGFLRYMVRLIINHVVKYATKKTDIDILDIIKERSRIHTKEMAPASGLYLYKINY